MKNIFVCIIFSVLVFSCSSNKEENSKKNKSELEYIDQENPAEISAENFEYNFGEIAQGEKISHVFKFTNTGKSSLVINDAKSTCGCTIPTYTKEPIAPGETGELLVKFDSKGKKGNINKQVTVQANTYPNTSTIFYIKGNVITPK